MAEIVRNNHTPKADVEATNKSLAAVGELLFQPSPLHQTLKAQFWARYEDTPFQDKSSISLLTVQHYIDDSRLRKYWDQPGFAAWFTNKDETRERAEYLWMVGLDAAEQILRDPGAQASAKVNLLKLLAEITGRAGKMKVEPAKEDMVGKMSEAELKDWLKRKGVSVQATYKVTPNTEETFPMIDIERTS